LRRFAPPPHEWGGQGLPIVGRTTPPGAICPSGASRHLPMNGEETNQLWEIIDRLSVGYTAGVARTLNLAVHTVRREAFVEAAQRLMQSRGYQQMSIQDVLDELQASRGAFYHYFDSTQALLEAVIDRLLDAAPGVVVMLLQGFQDVATELFLARQAGEIDPAGVEQTFTEYAAAFDRILGAPAGAVNLIDRAVLNEWFG